MLSQLEAELTIITIVANRHLIIILLYSMNEMMAPKMNFFHSSATASFILSFSLRRSLACQVSAIKFAGIRQVCPFPLFSTVIIANIVTLLTMLPIAGKFNPSGCAILSHEFSKLPHRRDRKKIARCVRGDQIRRDRRIKLPGVSPALGRREYLWDVHAARMLSTTRPVASTFEQARTYRISAELTWIKTLSDARNKDDQLTQ